MSESTNRDWLAREQWRLSFSPMKVIIISEKTYSNTLADSSWK